MAKDHGSSVKDDRLYEKLRKQGESKEKAARVANVKAGGSNVSKQGGKGGSYEDRTKKELATDNLGIISSAPEIETLARTVPDA